MMQMILEGNSRTEIIRHHSQLSIKKIITNNYPGMASLKKHYGEESLEKALAILLIDASRAFDTPLNRENAMEIALEIHTRYYYLSLEDCYYVLKTMKSKPIYGKLNMNKILCEFEQYEKERITFSENMNYNQHLSQSDSGGNRHSDGKSMKEILRKHKY